MHKALRRGLCPTPKNMPPERGALDFRRHRSRWRRRVFARRACVLAAPEEFFDPPFELRARHENVAATAHAANADICAKPDDFPSVASAGMGLPGADDVADEQFEGLHLWEAIRMSVGA